jgi:peroxiredoxin
LCGKPRQDIFGPFVKATVNTRPNSIISPWRRLMITSALSLTSLSILGLTQAATAPARSSAKAAAITVKDVNGETVKPLYDTGQKATVLFFVMHECPIANSYAPEISRITAKYADRGIRSFVVYVESDLTPEQAREHARDYGYKSGALLDPQHLLLKAAGATVSPEAAVLSPSGELLYRGRIDDRAVDFGKRRAEPTHRDLHLALDALLAGKPLPARLTKAVGCYIPEDHLPKPDRKKVAP